MGDESCLLVDRSRAVGFRCGAVWCLAGVLKGRVYHNRRRHVCVRCQLRTSLRRHEDCHAVWGGGVPPPRPLPLLLLLFVVFDA